MRLLIVFIAALACVAQASAWPIRGSSNNSGGAVLNLGTGELVPANFINIFKSAVLAFSTASDINKLDADGYFTSAPSGNVTVGFPSGGFTDGQWDNVQYTLSWPATKQFQIRFNNSLTSCSATGATVSGCTGSGSTTVTTTGGAGSVTMTNGIGGWSVFFVGGGSPFASTGSGEIALYRTSDAAAYATGQYFTPEFRNLVGNLRPRAIRPMGWVQTATNNFNGETTWANRIKPADFTWGAKIVTGIRSPDPVSGTDTYTGTAAPNTPVSWTDGEQWLAVFPNANTSSTVTIDIGGRGAKSVVQRDGASPLLIPGSTCGTNAHRCILANSITLLTYDALLDKVLCCSVGLAGSIPIEAQIQLANSISTNLWGTIPAMASDSYATSYFTAVRDGLNASLVFYPEYTNELWNNQFPQTGLGTARGQALGWSTASNQAYSGWYSLRVRQLMGNIAPTVFSGQMSRLRRVIAYQAGASADTVLTNRFNGTQLNSASFPAYGTYTGGANYDTFPNRPIDAVDVISYAPYAGGTNLCTGVDVGCTPNSSMLAFYQALVDAVEAGNTTTAVSLVDDDIRQGRLLSQSVTASGTTFTTPVAHGFTASSTPVIFQVTGGTLYSGISANTLYLVSSTPTSTTFTIQAYVDGFPSGSNVNAGSAGTGSVTVGASPYRNLLNLASTWYKFGESNAALYDSARGGAGMANLRVEQYEGNLEPKGLTSAQCTTVGVTGVTAALCAADIAAAIISWKNDNKAALTQRLYFDQFMGADPTLPPTYGLMAHSYSPSQLVLLGGGDYGLLPSENPSATPYKTYDGFRAFSSN